MFVYVGIWTSFATLSLPTLFHSLMWMSAILLNSCSMPALNGGHDAIDITKVEKHTKSHRPPNIYIANIYFQGLGWPCPAIGRSRQACKQQNCTVARDRKSSCCATCLCLRIKLSELGTASHSKVYEDQVRVLETHQILV